MTKNFPSKKPFILISNDDGIEAPGIKHLWNALHENYDVAIVAPHKEKSGSSLATTMLKPLHIFKVNWEKDTPAWKVTGTPTDSIKLALSVLLKRKPDLVVSGINKGSNAGGNVLFSGTVGCAIESSFRNIPAIAFSCYDLIDPAYDVAEKYVPYIVDYFFKHPTALGTLVNVTFPKKDLPIKGFKLARQGLGRWFETPSERQHPEGHYYYWLGGRLEDSPEKKKDSDTHLLNDGYITAVPIKAIELTDHDYFENKKNDFEKYFQNIS
ncbi:MAG: 5'/3'-nucleotidase SurE [Parachlamydiales bacterium]|jgi:5'-nucleotidase